MLDQTPLPPPPPSRIQLDPSQLRTVQSILAQHLPTATVMAFGSRVGGKPRKYSDLDLAVTVPQGQEPLTLRTLRQLRESFEDSNLPICVDIVDWALADSSFKQAVTAQGMAAVQVLATH
jgi:uncharacterized protein